MNKLLTKISELDNLSKFIIILVLILLIYILIICFLVPIMFSPSKGFTEEYLLSFSTPENRHINLISFLFAIVFGAIFAIMIRKKETDSKSENELNIIKGVLSNSDKQIIQILETVEEITQDSLMFRLEWSRAKVSTILTNLEKRNLIQRRREGKTYMVFLTKKNKK